MTLEEAIEHCETSEEPSDEAFDVLYEAYWFGSDENKALARPYIFYTETHMDAPFDATVEALQDWIMENQGQERPAAPPWKVYEALAALWDAANNG